jgi:hypothetical protein
LRIQIEKFANEEMEQMFNFLKKIFKERVMRNPRNAEELQGDVFNYLLEGKVKPQSLKF